MRGRICLGIPIAGDVAPEVLEDYMRFTYYLGRRCPEWDFILGIKSKLEQFRARKTIAEAALQAQCEFIFWLDDDQIMDIKNDLLPSPTYGIVNRLVEHMDANPKMGICGALYHQREGACFPVVMHKPLEEGGPYRFFRDDELRGELQPCDATGGGVMLMRTRMLWDIPQPWWVPEHSYGTDIQICKKAQEAGWEVWCDTGIEVGHLQKQRSVVTRATKQRYVTDLLEKQMRYGRSDFQVCVCGWYYEPVWLHQLDAIAGSKMKIIAHQDAPEAVAKEFSGYLIPSKNIGLEFGAYNTFIHTTWDGQSAVLFCHDDISLDGDPRELKTLIEENLRIYDQFYIFEDTHDIAYNRAKHGRMMVMSGPLLKWTMDNASGIWFDQTNVGENCGEEVNKGIVAYDQLMAQAAAFGYRTRGVCCLPTLRLKRRGTDKWHETQW